MALGDYPDVLTVEEVTKILGMGRNAVYRAIAAGDIPSFRVGPKLIRISKKALEGFINAGISAPANTG